MDRIWNKTSSAIAALAKINPDQLTVYTEQPVVGPRHLILDGAALEPLDTIREAFLTDKHGTYEQACKRDMAASLLAEHRAQPSVQDVLYERFGNPANFGSPGADVTAAWRAAAWAKLDDRIAA